MGAAKRLRWCSGTCPRSPILLPLTIQAHPADPKSIDHRPPRPSASRRLVRTTPHLPMQPLGHSAARPLDATGVATLHRQRSMVKVPLSQRPSSAPAPLQSAPDGPGWRALPGGEAGA